MATIRLIGVPLDLGQSRRGVDMGPSALRIASLAPRLADLGHRIEHRGNLEIPDRDSLPAHGALDLLPPIAEVCSRLALETAQAVRDGALPFVLGGDHSIAAGSVAGVATALAERGERVGLVWMDAHGDLNTPESSLSGNVHGMPLAALLGPEPAELSKIGTFAPKVLPQHTVLVGIRNLDEREKIAVRDSGVHVFTMKDIDRQGIASIVEEAVRLAGSGTAGIHVSFDMDVCDPLIAPGVGTPVKGGLDYREAHMVMEIVADSGLLTSLDLVEVNPTLDVRNATAQLGTELALSALGMKIL